MVVVHFVADDASQLLVDTREEQQFSDSASLEWVQSMVAGYQGYILFLQNAAMILEETWDYFDDNEKIEVAH